MSLLQARLKIFYREMSRMKKTAKKLTALLLATIAIFSMAPAEIGSGIAVLLCNPVAIKAEAASYSGTCGENVRWLLNTDSGILSITGTGNMDDWSFLSPPPWASYRLSIKSVTIEQGVISIGKCAFRDAIELTEITLPVGLKKINDYAFAGCKLLTDIAIPSGVTTIGNWAFDGCSVLKNVTIPTSVTTMQMGVFENCVALESVVIPNRVKSVSGMMFSGCTALKSVVLPSGVTGIWDDVFSGCSSLVDIAIPSTVTHMSKSAFEGTGYYNDDSNWINGVLYIGNYLIAAKTSVSGTYTAKSGTITIASSAFEDCSSLTGISLPATVKNIGSNAFKGTGYYNKGANWNEGVLYIGKYLIEANNSVPNVYSVNDGTLVIADCAFQNCTSLKSIENTEDVTRIGSKAFYGCGFLRRVELPLSITWVGEEAFSACDMLENVYYVGTQVQRDAIRIESGNECLTGAEWTNNCNMLLWLRTPSVTEIRYGDTLILHAAARRLPSGAKVVWIYEGAKVRLKAANSASEYDDWTCNVQARGNGTATVTVKVVDRNNNVLKDADGNELIQHQTINVKSGIWDRVASFFRMIFGIARIIYS